MFEIEKLQNKYCGRLAIANQAGQKNCNQFWLRFFWAKFDTSEDTSHWLTFLNTLDGK
jgi:hypothetical protein